MKHPFRFMPSLAMGILFSVTLLFPRLAMAHAVLVASMPAANATVQGPEVAVHLKFNSRVDAKRSTLLLEDQAGKERSLTVSAQDAPDTLAAQTVKLQPGTYTILWQALSSDGHITRGKIPFVVR